MKLMNLTVGKAVERLQTNYKFTAATKIIALKRLGPLEMQKYAKQNVAFGLRFSKIYFIPYEYDRETTRNRYMLMRLCPALYYLL